MVKRSKHQGSYLLISVGEALSTTLFICYQTHKQVLGYLVPNIVIGIVLRKILGKE